MVPKQRGAGQTGGWGGQFTNRGRSVSRGGSPSRGGAGGGKTPRGGKGCALWLFFLAAVVATVGAQVVVRIFS